MKKYFAVACLLIFFSCTNSDHTSTADSEDSTGVAVNHTDSSDVKLTDPKVQAIYDDYVSLKNALVATNYVEAKTTASALKSSLSNYEGCESTATIAGKIAGAEDVASQRKEFTYLSADVIAMFKHAALNSGSIYVQHCPMANGGDGGDWLSSNKNIQNPYYGDKMMTCGAVLQEIK